MCVLILCGCPYPLLPCRSDSPAVSDVAKQVTGPLGKGLRASAKIAKVSGQVFDGALILVSIGLDITELATADSPAGKALAGLQLGLDTGLGLVTGASILTSAIGSLTTVATATLATVSGVLGAITVPLAGLTIGIMGLAQNYIVLEGEMDATALLFDAVQKNATLQFAFNQTANVINLAGGMAPIKDIDFHRKTIEYGEINLPRVRGGAGRGTGYWLSGPDIWNHDEYFNVLDKEYVLERAEIEDAHGKGFAFTYMFMIFPPFIMWEEAMVLSTSDVVHEEIAAEPLAA